MKSAPCWVQNVTWEGTCTSEPCSQTRQVTSAPLGYLVLNQSCAHCAAWLCSMQGFLFEL